MPADKPPVVARSIRWVVAGAIVLTLGANVSRAWLELLFSAPSYGRQWEARYQALEQAAARGQRTVQLRPILQVQPRHILLRGYDNQPDYGNIRNTNVAKWYGLDSVRTDPGLMSQALY